MRWLYFVVVLVHSPRSMLSLQQLLSISSTQSVHTGINAKVQNNQTRDSEDYHSLASTFPITSTSPPGHNTSSSSHAEKAYDNANRGNNYENSSSSPFKFTSV